MPVVIQRNCHTCGEPLDGPMASLGLLNHPNCDPVPQDIELVAPPPVTDNIFATPGVVGVPAPEVAAAIKSEFTTMLLWSEHSRPRSRQVNIGPSELGVECERRLAYRVMGLNRGDDFDASDPWPAFVGSSIHSRVEEAVKSYQAAHPHAPRWSIEEWVQADPNINGRADFNRDEILADLKSAGKDVMDKVKKSGPPLKYRIQQMIYAKGLRDKGKMIKYICLVFVPRSGWLRDMYVWAEPYDEALALHYINRPYRIAANLRTMGIKDNPHLWEQVPATPDYVECGYCPMWDKYIPDGLGATDKGCPGYQPGKKKEKK